MKYARATWWIFWAWLAARLRLPRRLVWDWEDEASMRMWACSLDFEPVQAVGSRASERIRRELADKHRGEVIPGSGAPVEPKLFAPKPIGWTCQHVSITAGGAASLTSASAWCACEMQPMYATTSS